MDLFGASASGKIKRAARLVSEANTTAPRDTQGARRSIEEAIALLQAVPQRSDELLSGLADAVIALGRLEWLAGNPVRASQLFDEALGLGGALTGADADHFAEGAAESGRMDTRAIDAYLSYVERRRNAAAETKTGPVYTLLEQRCRMESHSQEEVAGSRLSSRVIASDGRLGFPYLWRGRGALAAAEYESALSDLRCAEERGAPSTELSFLVALCSAIEEKRQKNLEAAAALFCEAARLDTYSLLAHVEAGVCLVQTCMLQGGGTANPEEAGDAKVNKAIALLRRACEIDDRSAVAHFELGRACLLNREIEGAMVALQKAVTLEPSAGHFVEYARALRRAGSTEEAIAAAETSLRLQPDLLSAHKLIGAIAMRDRDFPRAVSAYRSIVAARPPEDFEHRNALFNIGLCSFEMGDATEAIRCLSALEAQDLQLSREGRTTLARSFLRASDLESARARLQDLVSEEPGDGVARYYFGCCLARQGRFEAAIEAFDAAEIAGAPVGKAALQRGLALEASGQPDAARRAYEQAIEQADLPEARRRLVQLCWKTGDRAQAVVHALSLERDALDVRRTSGSPDLSDRANPSDAAYLTGLACLCEGDANGAARAWAAMAPGPFRDSAVRVSALHAARRAREAGDPGAALKNWDAAVAAGALAQLLRSDCAVAAAILVVEAYRSGSPSATWKPLLTRALELNHEAPEAQVLNASLNVLSCAGDPEAGADEAPGSLAVQCLVSRAAELLNRGRCAEAEEVVRAALQLSPDHPEAQGISAAARAKGPPARLSAGERDEAEAGWEREFAIYRRTKAAHSLAVLNTWSAVRAAPEQRDEVRWRKAIGYWVYVLNDSAYLEAWSANRRGAYEADHAMLASLESAVRKDLTAWISPQSPTADPEPDEIEDDLTMDCWAEFEVARLLRAAGVKHAYGPMMMASLGPPELISERRRREPEQNIGLGDCELRCINGIGDVIALCMQGHARALACLANGRFDRADALLSAASSEGAKSACRDEMLAFVRICRAENAYVHMKCPPVSAESGMILQYANALRSLIAPLANVREVIDSPGNMQALLRLVELLCRRTYNEFTSFDALGSGRTKVLQAAVEIIDQSMSLAERGGDIEEARLYLAALLNLLALQMDAGAHDAVVGLLTRAAALAPDNPNYRRNLAFSHYNRYIREAQSGSDQAIVSGTAKADIARAYELAPYDEDIQAAFQRLQAAGTEP